jgi:cytidine deaminase
LKNKVEIIQVKVERNVVNDELNNSETILLEKAIAASKNAYAPYSRFNVGAAVLLADGTIVIGNNQENVAYPSGLCAERVAFFAAGAQYPGMEIRSVAIYAYSDVFEVKDAVAPCGACRQAMAEYELKQGKPISLLIAGPEGNVKKITDVSSLLPLIFNETNLKKV